MIYDNRRGILNWFLEAIGQEDKTQVWLNNPDLVMTLVAIPLIWQFIGYYMVILLSATSTIDKEILESAELDGASAFQRAIYVADDQEYDCGMYRSVCIRKYESL